MQYGACGWVEVAASAAMAGYDYFETSVGALLKPREDDAAFRAALDTVRASALPCPVVNCFVPGDLPITGPSANLDALRAYVQITCERAAEAGVDTIVFGSGGARRIPDGFDRADAWEQLVAFGEMVGPIAHDQGVTVVVEPLACTECNVLNTVDESAALVRAVDHPAFRLLVDAYHWLRDDLSTDAIVRNGFLLAHTHIATIPSRRAPGSEPCDFAAFFGALVECRYQGRMSLECKLDDRAMELPLALETIEALVDAGPN